MGAGSHGPSLGINARAHPRRTRRGHAAGDTAGSSAPETRAERAGAARGRFATIFGPPHKKRTAPLPARAAECRATIGAREAFEDARLAPADPHGVVAAIAGGHAARARPAPSAAARGRYAPAFALASAGA